MRRTCEVATSYPRVDLEYDGNLYLGAALLGAGGIMGSNSKDGWLDIGTRWRVLQATGAVVRMYTVLTEDRKKQEGFDLPASKCRLRAIYEPGYACTLVNRRAA